MQSSHPPSQSRKSGEAPGGRSAGPFDAIVRDLRSRGYAIAGDAVGLPVIDDDLIDSLVADAQVLDDGGDLRPAQVGAGTRRTLARAVRGDRIRWIDPACPTLAQRQYLALVDELRVQLNRELLLGLFDVEAHLALYPPGAHYDRHVDQLAGRDERVVSLVLYLNRDWAPGNGGELLLYLPDGREQLVEPVAGTLVAFLSDQFPHAVLPTERERLSITAWLRRRPAGAPLLP